MVSNDFHPVHKQCKSSCYSCLVQFAAVGLVVEDLICMAPQVPFISGLAFFRSIFGFEPSGLVSNATVKISYVIPVGFNSSLMPRR